MATDGALVEYNVGSSASQRSQDYNAGFWPWSADNTVVQFNEVYGTRGQHDAEGRRRMTRPSSEISSEN